MFCRKCGAEIPNDSEFCSKCGAKVIKDEPRMDEEKDNIEHRPMKNDSETMDISAIDTAEVLSEAGIKRSKPGRYWIGGILALSGLTSCISYPVSHIRYGTEIPQFDISMSLIALLVGVIIIYNAKRYTRDNKAGYDEAISEHKDPMPYVEIRKIALRHPKTGLIKKCDTGYCWGMFLFNCFCPLYRGDLKWFAIFGIATIFMGIVSAGILGLAAGPIFAFFYNKRYIREEIEKGYLPADIVAKEWLERTGLIKLP